jgi:pyridoxamine 5'-phosphate oxidase
MLGLVENEMSADPIEEFRRWLRQAETVDPDKANVATLATSTRDGKPSARIVLLKGVDERGFVFFTNYTSRKGRELAENPLAAIVCYWPALDRQVRIEGSVEKVTPAESDEYHRTRPRGSQLGAWTSSQSEVIAGREVLEARLRELIAKFGDGELPRPPYWGGYRLKPDVIEFWQNRADRLHDRIRYRRDGAKWLMERLAP